MVVPGFVQGTASTAGHGSLIQSLLSENPPVPQAGGLPPLNASTFILQIVIQCLLRVLSRGVLAM